MKDRSIGFIGTGQIGEPMVERLLGAGRRVSTFTRRSEVRERLATAGARVVDNPGELSDVDVLITCLFDDEQISDVCTPVIDALRPGTVFISHTTGSPKYIRLLGDSAAQRGVGVVDASFSGTADHVRRGELTVLLGGQGEHTAVAEDVVGVYANRVLCAGALGSGLTIKLLNNILFAACTQLTLTAIEAATSMGIAEDDFLGALATTSGGSAAAGYLAAAPVSAAEFAEHLPHFLSKDVAAALAAADDIGLEIGSLMEATRMGPMELRSTISAPV